MKEIKVSPQFEKKLEIHGITRRQFLKICSGVAALIGLSHIEVPKIVKAIESASKKPSVLWTSFSACTGCTESLLKSGSPSAAKIILDIISLDYHNTIMTAAGDNNIEILNNLIKKGGYIWIAEGAVPTMIGAGRLNRQDFTKVAKRVGAKAQTIISVGACASTGGIPSADPNPTGAKSISKSTGYKTINLTGCPPNPDWMVATLIYYLTYKKAPPLDNKNRPKFIYKQTIHDLCPRRGMFEAGNFVSYPGAPEDALGYCLYKVGCKGPAAPGNCPSVLWNQKTNWCNGAGQCIGCTDFNFPEAEWPFYKKLPGIPIPGFAGTTITADKIGAVTGVAAAVGIGAHAVTGIYKGIKNKKKGR